MKRKLLLVLAFIALPGFASALGLGKLQLNSALNQPFDARIELPSTSALELQSLHVGLADTEAFRRAKIDRPFVLSKLKFVVIENENDPDYIQISSRDVIREPYLNFLLEANWSTGRIYREYTVLLDPPLHDPNVNRSRQTQSYSSPSSSENSYIDDDTEAVSDSVSSISPQVRYNDSQYGPTDSLDTLWAIATQVRSDPSVSVQQMMMALLRSNPEAFINGNINGLKRGQILNIPSRDEISDLSLQEAISEVGAQNSDWGGSGITADTVSERADSMSIADDDSNSFDDEPLIADMISDDESELRLVAASSDGEGIAQSGGDSGQASNIDLTLANEQLQTVTQENIELQDRMQEAETIISDLKRLISLKDDELATLQNQMAADSMVEQDEVVEAIAETADAGDFVNEEIDEEEHAIDEDGLAEDFLEEDEDSALAMEVDDEDIVTDIVAGPGIVDQVLGFITSNLVVIAGALGGLIIAIVALLFISRRKQNAATEEVPVSATDFPDFEDMADVVSDSPALETGPATNIDIDKSEDETMQPVGKDEEADNKNVFVAPSDPEPEAAPEPEEPEEDPLAEVNVFLAYKHFDQAEEFVQEAISGDPENLGFHTKLLEVFYVASDKKGYEDAAQVLHDKVNGEGLHWEMAQAMWQEMSPNRALFEEGADDELAGKVGGFMDTTAEEEGNSEARDDNIIDFNVDSSYAEEGIELDLSIGDDIDESFDILDDTADEGLEIDLSIDEDDGSPDLDLDIGELEVDSGSGDELDLDLEIQEDEPKADEMDMDSTVEMPSLSMEGMSLQIDDDDTVFVPRASAADEQSDEDEIATKLDLAKAYVELGDGDSAKDILDDVLVDGSAEQKKTAQNLLNQLN